MKYDVTDLRTNREILWEQNWELSDNISEVIEILEDWRGEIESHLGEIDGMKEEDITEEEMEEEERNYSDNRALIEKIRMLI
jgi:hypothetical protein